MAKQPEVETPEEALVEEGSGKGKGRGTRARVTLEGDVPPSTLRRVIPGDSEKEDAEDSPRKKVSFSKAIQNTAYRIIAKRISPTMTDEGAPLGDEYEITPHDDLTESEIRGEIQQNRGGTKWIVRVVDGDMIVATKPFMVGGEPMQDPLMAQVGTGGQPHRGGGGGPDGLFAQGSDDSDDQPSEEEVQERIAAEIEGDPEVKERLKRARLDQLEIERMRRDMEKAKVEAEMRRLREEINPPKRDEGDSVKKAIEEATRPLAESNARLQRELDERSKAAESERALEARLAPMRSAMEAMAAKLNAPPPPQQGPTASELLSKMDAMAANIKSDTTAQITNAIGQLTAKYDTQFTNILTQLAGIANRPQDGGALAQAAVGALTQIATKKEDGGGRSDPFETTAKVFELVKGAREMTGLDAKGDTTVPPDFPSFLVDRVTNLAPQVIEYLEKKQGGPIGREELEKMFKEYGIRMWQELDGTIKREVRGGLQKIATQRPSLPPPGTPAMVPTPQRAAAPGPFAPPPPGAPGAHPQSGIPQAVPTTPPPAPPTAPPPPSVPIVRFTGSNTPETVAAPPPAIPAHDESSIEAETRDRVNWVLRGLLREMKLGVQEMQWPEKAYGNLPKDVLDRIVTASTDKDVYDAISPWAEREVLDEIYKYVTEGNPQHDFYRQWLTAGVNWIKDEATAPPDEPGEPGTT